MPNLSVKKDGAWKDVKGFHVKKAGTWEDVKKGFVKKGGVWEQFYPPSVPITAVNIPSNLSASEMDGSNDEIFMGESVTIEINSITGGTAPYSYNWFRSGPNAAITSGLTSGSTVILTYQDWVDIYETETSSEKWKVTVTDTHGNSATSNECTVTISLENFCFSAETPILLENGEYKPAGDLVAGDTLKSFSSPSMIDESVEGWRDWTSGDLSDGTFSTSNVVNAVKRMSDHYYLLNDGVKVTAEHPFMAYRNGQWGWIKVKNLRSGDQFMTEEGNNIVLENIKRIDEEIEVVSIGVEDIDTYFAGSFNGQAILVHNK